MDLSVVILSWNTMDLLASCLRSLENDGFPYEREVIVVDNRSSDGSPDMVEEDFPWVRLFREKENHGYSKGNNIGARRASGKRICFLGSDTEVRPGALELLYDFLEDDSSYGAAAPRLVSRDGKTQRACMRFPGILTALTFDNVLGRFPPGKWIQDRYYMKDFDHRTSRDVPQPPATCLMMGREVFLAMGGMDEHMFLFFNDVDLCKRIWVGGKRIRFLADAEVFHHLGASTSRFDRMPVQWQIDRLFFYRKWYGKWAGFLLKLLVLERGLEEWFAIRKRLKDKHSRKAALGDLKNALKEVLKA